MNPFVIAKFVVGVMLSFYFIALLACVAIIMVYNQRHKTDEGESIEDVWQRGGTYLYDWEREGW